MPYEPFVPMWTWRSPGKTSVTSLLDYRTVGPRYVQGSYVPEFGPEGEVTGFVLSALDITERHRLRKPARQSSPTSFPRMWRYWHWDWIFDRPYSVGHAFAAKRPVESAAVTSAGL